MPTKLDTLVASKSRPLQSKVSEKNKNSSGHGSFRWLKSFSSTKAKGQKKISNSKALTAENSNVPVTTRPNKSSQLVNSSSRDPGLHQPPVEPANAKASPILSTPLQLENKPAENCHAVPCAIPEKEPAYLTSDVDDAVKLVESRAQRDSAKEHGQEPADVSQLMRDKESSQEDLVRARQIRQRLLRFLDEGQNLIVALENALVDCERSLQEAEDENAYWKAQLAGHEQAVKDAEALVREKSAMLETEKRSFQRLAAGFIQMEFEKVTLLERWKSNVAFAVQ